MCEEEILPYLMMYGDWASSSLDGSQSTPWRMRMRHASTAQAGLIRPFWYTYPEGIHVQSWLIQVSRLHSTILTNRLIQRSDSPVYPAPRYPQRHRTLMTAMSTLDQPSTMTGHCRRAGSDPTTLSDRARLPLRRDSPRSDPPPRPWYSSAPS